MKKYLLPSALILIGLLALANAQTINKALQLSQDPTGSFGVDTANNVYFPAHVLNTALNGTPTVSQLSGSAPTVTGSDFAGTISGGNANTTTTGVLLFAKAFVTAPICVAVSQNTGTSPLAYNVVATGLNITSNIAASVINYVCVGNKT